MKRGDRLRAALRLISGHDDLAALPDVTLGGFKLPEGDRREVALDRKSALGGSIHTTEVYDLDDVKRMIGLDNEIAALKKSRKSAPYGAGKTATHSPGDLLRAYETDALTPQMLDFVRALGRRYMFGDSREVRDYKAIVERVYTRGAGRFDLTSVCFGTIRILNGWSLVLTPSIQMFCAARLLLEPQARVRRRGNVDISFNVSEIRVVQPELPI
jgi:hypothetical protein